VYTLLFFPSKCSLFHNSNLFGSCIIHILFTWCAEIKKKNSGTKRLIRSRVVKQSGSSQPLVSPSPHLHVKTNSLRQNSVFPNISGKEAETFIHLDIHDCHTRISLYKLCLKISSVPLIFHRYHKNCRASFNYRYASLKDGDTF